MSKALAGAAAWNLLGTVGGQAVNVLNAFLLLHSLGKAHYGFFVWLTSGFLMTTGLLSSATTITVVRYLNAGVLSTNLSEGLKSFSLAGTSIVLAIVTVGAAFQYFKGDIDLAHLLLLVPFSICFSFERKKAFYIGELIGKERFRANAIMRLLDSVCLIALTVSGAYCFSVEGAIIGFFSSVILRFYLFRFVTKAITLHDALVEEPARPQAIEKEDVTKFAAFTSVSGIFVTPIMWLATTSLMINSGTSAVAVFNILNQWRSVGVLVSNNLNTVILPRLSSSFSRSKAVRYISAAAILSVSSNLFLYALRPTIFTAFGIADHNSVSFVFLLLMNFFLAVSSAVGTILTGQGFAGLNLLSNAAWCLICVVTLMCLGTATLQNFCLSLMLSQFLHLIALATWRISSSQLRNSKRKE